MPPQEQPTYTVDIPGLSDFFKLPIPALNDPELKKQRIERFRTKVSPVPEQLQWVPRAINFVDDIQDLLITFLWLARPFIPGLPGILLMFFGRGLFVASILDIITLLLALTMMTATKRLFTFTTAADGLYAFKDPKGAILRFARPWGWRRHVGALLQAGQAAYTLSGYGLSLGALMGAVSDTMWGSVRQLQGNQVIFRGPPPADPVGKAARIITQAPEANIGGQIYSKEDHLLILAGLSTAINILRQTPRPVDENRLAALDETEIPLFVPWETSTRAALAEAGYDPDAPPPPMTNLGITNPTYHMLIEESFGRVDVFEDELLPTLDPGKEAGVWWWLQERASSMVLTKLLKFNFSELISDVGLMKLVLAAAESGYRPPRDTFATQHVQWVITARRLAETEGYTMPRPTHFERASLMLFGDVDTKEPEFLKFLPPGGIASA